MRNPLSKVGWAALVVLAAYGCSSDKSPGAAGYACCVCSCAASSSSGSCTASSTVSGSSLADCGTECARACSNAGCPRVTSAQASNDCGGPGPGVLAEGGVVAPPYDAGKTPPKPLTVASNQGSPDPFVGDAVGLYWIDSGGRRLVTAPFAGGTATLAADLHGPSALATDGTDAFVAETGSIYSGSVKGILRVPVAGGAGTLMLNGVSASELAAAGGLLYFVAQSAVQRVPTAGGTPEVLAKTNGIVFALAASGGCAVYVESGLRRVCEPSGSVDVLDPQGGSPIAVDAGEVIYVAYVSGGKQLRRIPDKGGSATTVADLRNEPLLAALAADATHVFVAYQGTSSKSYYDGIVDRVPRAGGVAESLATGQRDPSGLALDDTYVYWANRGNGTIVKTPKVSP